jgi:hypothetical protein
MKNNIINSSSELTELFFPTSKDLTFTGIDQSKLDTIVFDI